MIAQDTGYQSLREEAFGWSDEGRFLECLTREKVVLQAPFLAHMLHYLKEYVDENSLCVVMMKRPVEEILASQQRMFEQFKTGSGIWAYRLRKFHALTPMPEVVYETWEYQQTRIKYWMEVQYSDLKRNKLWVEDRSQFHFRQTSR
jgi:hypothetical protein